MRTGLIRRVVSAVTAAAFAMPIVAPSALAQQQRAGGITRTEYEGCQTREEGAFRKAIEDVVLASLKRGLAGVDYRPIVQDEWRRVGFDEIMNKRVDAAIDEIRNETSWTDLISSLASKETAQQLATSAAERVYRSDEIKKAIEALAVGVGRELGKRIELATVDTAEPAMQCLQAFLGPRYGRTIAGIVSQDAGQEFSVDANKNAATVSSGQVLASGRDGIAGAVILIVRRQLAGLAARVGQRIVGAVLSRLVTVVAGGIGVVLIAKDIWELRNGVLPIIANEMKSAATRDKVQEELAKAISEQIGEHVREIGSKTADRIVEIWQEFKRAHAKVVEIADRNDRFRQFIDTVKPQNLARLDETVALVLASEGGEPAVLTRLENGTLHAAIEKLPAAAFDIARELRSLETAFRWQALAGNSLAKVVEHEVYRRNGPEEFSKAALARILAIDDRLAITRLASLKGGVREPLMDLDDTNLKKLARGVTETDLGSLSTYLTTLAPNARQRLLSAVTDVPARLAHLATPSVRDAIIASADQSAALGIMLRSGSLFEPFTFLEDMRMVSNGKVSPRVVWARYPLPVAVFGFVGLLLFMLFWRMLFGRRRRA